MRKLHTSSPTQHWNCHNSPHKKIKIPPNLTLMQSHGLGDNHIGGILFPAPLGADGVLVVAPAKHTFIRTRQGRRGFHALIRSDAVKGVFVAATTAAQLVLGPAADLHRTVCACGRRDGETPTKISKSTIKIKQIVESSMQNTKTKRKELTTSTHR